MSEYDPNEAIRIVEEALGLIDKTSKREALAFTDSVLLESLFDVLKKYVPNHQDVSLAINDIKDSLLESYSKPQNKEKSLHQLHTVVNNCRKCPRVVPEPTLPVWNKIDPDVLFILESPIGNNDQPLIQAMKESGFSSSRVGLTSITRCNMPYGEKLSPEEISNCSTNFIFDEIQLMSPKLIVPLGKIASSVILGRDVSIKDEKGKTFWLGIWQVMPTVSPRGVAHNERIYSDLQQDIRRAYSIVYGKGI